MEKPINSVVLSPFIFTWKVKILEPILICSMLPDNKQIAGLSTDKIIWSNVSRTKIKKSRNKKVGRKGLELRRLVGAFTS